MPLNNPQRHGGPCLSLRQLPRERDERTEKIIGAAIEVHRTLGAHFQELMYQRALVMEFRKWDLEFERTCGSRSITKGSNYRFAEWTSWWKAACLRSRRRQLSRSGISSRR